MDPEPVMMAPLRFPSMDSEFAMVTIICGCAGMAMVSGTCEMGVGAGGAAMAGSEGYTSRAIAPAMPSIARARGP